MENTAGRTIRAAVRFQDWVALAFVAARFLTAPINFASMVLTTTCRYPTFASLVANSIASLISGDSGAEALADEHFRTLQERFARRLPKRSAHLGNVRGSFRLFEAEASAQETLHSL